MVGATLKGFFESGSYWDLLLIFSTYSFCWGIYIVLGHLFNDSKQQKIWHIENGLFLGAFCLLTKGYLPPLLFQIAILLSFAFVFRSANMGWLRAMLMAAGIDVLVLLSDFVFIQSVIFFVPGCTRFITETAAGIATGTIMESIFPLVSIFIWREVKSRWNRTKFRKSLLKSGSRKSTPKNK